MENAGFFFSLQSFQQNHFKTKMGKEPCRSVLLMWVDFELDHPKQFTICKIISTLPHLKNVKFLEKEKRKEKNLEFNSIVIHSCLDGELTVFSKKKKSISQFQQAKLSQTTSNTQVPAHQIQPRFFANSRITTTRCIYRSKLIVHAAVSQRWWSLCTLNTLAVQAAARELGVVNSIRLNVYHRGT